MVESFLDTFKTELVADRVWRSRSQLELAVVEYVSWFNNERLHESLGDVGFTGEQVSASLAALESALAPIVGADRVVAFPIPPKHTLAYPYPIEEPGEVGTRSVKSGDAVGCHPGRPSHILGVMKMIHAVWIVPDEEPVSPPPPTAPRCRA